MSLKWRELLSVAQEENPGASLVYSHVHSSGLGFRRENVQDDMVVRQAKRFRR